MDTRQRVPTVDQRCCAMRRRGWGVGLAAVALRG